MRLALAKGAHGALIRQIEADAALLARMGVMDYSLLLGVHYSQWGDQAWYPPGRNLTVSLQLKGLLKDPIHRTWVLLLAHDPAHATC